MFPRIRCPRAGAAEQGALGRVCPAEPSWFSSPAGPDAEDSLVTTGQAEE